MPVCFHRSFYWRLRKRVHKKEHYGAKTESQQHGDGINLRTPPRSVQENGCLEKSGAFDWLFAVACDATVHEPANEKHIATCCGYVYPPILDSGRVRGVEL
jgi:hypothetical protein